MKKKLIILMALALTASTSLLTGCGGDAESSQTSGTIHIEETTAEETTQAATEAATTVPTTTVVKETKPQPTTEAPATEPATTKAVQQSKPASSVVNGNNASSSKASSKPVSKPVSKPASSAAQATGSFSASDVIFSYNGKTVALGENMNNVIAKIGKANSVVSAPSCHGVGEDKTYTYNGFEIYTYPSGNTEAVSEIYITSSSIPTAKGIKVGDSEAKVLSTYGKSYTMSGNYYVFSAGQNKSLEFYIINGIVENIDYYYDI